VLSRSGLRARRGTLEMLALPGEFLRGLQSREDSNLQPSGYERPTLPSKLNNNRHFRARSLASVHVWLWRIIGYLLVGQSG
jgi:hypothetical protein